MLHNRNFLTIGIANLSVVSPARRDLFALANEATGKLSAVANEEIKYSNKFELDVLPRQNKNVAL
jgi:hypothetical protein